MGLNDKSALITGGTSGMGARLRDEWRARAAEHGLSQDRVEELLTPRWRA
jgi:NAD(P)-dependent dehydrogenase (short-subunit alcohol dehydrogenase family)